jgi:hypothetical protein
MSDTTDPAAAAANVEDVAPEDFAALIAASSTGQLKEIVNGPARK